MKSKFLISSLFLATLFGVSSCIDDKYDLSDIDTTSQIKVKNLEIPVNLKEITLDRVLDVDEDENAVITTFSQNGKTYYAIQKRGEFNASPVNVSKINAPMASTNPVSKVINVPEGFNPSVASLKVGEIAAEFNYDIQSVDNAIRSIQNLTIDPNALLDMTINFNSGVLNNSGAEWSLSNVVVRVPEGFSGHYGNYEISENGTITVPTVIDNGNTKAIHIDIDYLDLEKTFPSTNGLVNEDGNINIGGMVSIESADLKVSGISSLPSQVDLTIDFNMGPFSVDSFSGEINYEIEAPSISPVNLSDLPDFLTGPGSEITLLNPQIYFSVKNTPGYYGVEAVSGLTIQPYHNGETQVSPISTEFSIGENSLDGYFNLVMAPYPEDHSLNDFSQLEYVKVDNLNRILYGNGLPSSIDFNLNNPVIRGKTHNFPLGTELAFDGKYTFFSPLQFEKGSVIHYVKDENDWFSGDVDKMHVEHFELTAKATTNLPFDLTLIAYPYIKDGDNEYLDRENPAQAIIPAGAKEADIMLSFNKEIDGLNGIYFDAVIFIQDEEALNPDQFVMLNNIKAIVDGYYITKF